MTGIRKTEELKRQYGVIVEPDLHRAVESAHLLIIAVRPDSVHGLLKEIGAQLIRRSGSSESGSRRSSVQTARGLGSPVRWARAMPSPVCRSGRGLTALTFGRGLTVTARAQVRNLFAAVGTVLEIPENQFDAFTVTYSSSLGYHTLAALVAAAEAIGLDRKSARLAAAHALADGIAAWRGAIYPWRNCCKRQLRPAARRPAVMASLDDAGYGKILEQGLRAGIRQARKNAGR